MVASPCSQQRRPGSLTLESIPGQRGVRGHPRGLERGRPLSLVTSVRQGDPGLRLRVWLPSSPGRPALPVPLPRLPRPLLLAFLSTWLVFEFSQSSAGGWLQGDAATLAPSPPSSGCASEFSAASGGQATLPPSRPSPSRCPVGRPLLSGPPAGWGQLLARRREPGKDLKGAAAALGGLGGGHVSPERGCRSHQQKRPLATSGQRAPGERLIPGSVAFRLTWGLWSGSGSGPRQKDTSKLCRAPPVPSPGPSGIKVNRVSKNPDALGKMGTAGPHPAREINLLEVSAHRELSFQRRVSKKNYR